MNHCLLSDLRTDYGEALDQLFTQWIASLVDKGLVSVSRVSQDGVRVRVSAGASSFRREERLEHLLSQARQHVEQLRKQVEDPAQAGLSARHKAMRKRASEEKLRMGEYEELIWILADGLFGILIWVLRHIW